jgi:arylsulfatase A-like enzyme
VDDVGVDQGKLFGYGDYGPAAMPNITIIANDGVKFRDIRAIPVCSNSRTALYGNKSSLLAGSIVASGGATTPMAMRGQRSGIRFPFS